MSDPNQVTIVVPLDCSGFTLRSGELLAAALGLSLNYDETLALGYLAGKMARTRAEGGSSGRECTAPHPTFIDVWEREAKTDPWSDFRGETVGQIIAALRETEGRAATQDRTLEAVRARVDRDRCWDDKCELSVCVLERDIRALLDGHGEAGVE